MKLILVEILKLGLVKILKFEFRRNADVLFRFWSWCLVEIMKMKSDQDLFENLWYDLKKLLWLQTELNPRVRCAFGNVLFLCPSSWVDIRARTEWFEVCGSRKILLRHRWWVSPLILRLACRLLSSSQHGGPGAQVHSSPVNMLTGKEYTLDVGAMCAAKISWAPPNDKTCSSSATL